MHKMLGAAVVTTALSATAAAAQVPPVADVLRQNPTINPDRINEEQRQRLLERADPDFAEPRVPTVEAPPPAAATADQQPDVRFTLRQVLFDPSSYLPASELDALAAPLLGREVSLGELQGIVDRINVLYAARGLTTARALLPAQQIDAGIVRIRLIEGRIGAVTVEGASDRSGDYVTRRGAPPAGELASPQNLEQRLRLFNANNDAQLRARLAPGSDLGKTDVALTVAEPKRFSADVFSDNNGFASTGLWEIGAVLRGYRLFSEADRTTAVLVKSRGVFSGNLSLSAPIGDRLRVGASGSYGRTKVLFGPVAELGVTGESYSFGGDLAGLVVIDDRATVTATGSVSTSLSNTRIAGREVIRNELLNLSVGAVGSYAVPGFVANAQVQVTRAQVDERLSRTSARPVLFQSSLFVSKQIVPGVQGRLRGDWQVATTENLPGILQYQIGGSRSARAYSPGAAAGDRGVAASAELAYARQLGQVGMEVFGFVDHAQASIPGARFDAQAVGLGVGVNSVRASVRATIATDFGHSGNLDGSTRAFVISTLRF